MTDKLSRNNVRLHYSDLPASFSEKLKSFFGRQNALNDDVEKQLEDNQRQLEAIVQKLVATERELAQLKQSVTRLSKAGGQ